MLKILIVVVAASLLSACDQRHPVVGEAGCDVWNEAKGHLDGRMVEGEYAAGFFDAYSLSNPTREVKYAWVVDAINLECDRNPSSTIQDAAKKAAKRFEQ